LNLPNKKEIRKALDSFSKKEWFIFITLFIVVIISILLIFQKINQHFVIETPSRGGKISEGIIGVPRFVNPILALSDADKDLTTLLYSGLMRKTIEGDLIPDLAEKYEISKDKLIYTFTLKDKISFHDGEQITANDILFTINMVKNPIFKSPQRVSWVGVEVNKINNKTIQFVLKQPYAPFLEDTILGILPSHIWESLPSEQFSFSNLNIKGIGSGPYKVKKIKKNTAEIVTYYKLVFFKKFALGEPFIKKLIIRFYPNEDTLLDAFNNKEINQISAIDPKKIEDIKRKRNYRVETTILPRIFGLFFNQNQASIFTDQKIINALDKAIDKERIIKEVFNNYAVAIDSPIPPSLLDEEYKLIDSSQKLLPSMAKTVENRANAINILENSGWKLNNEGLLSKKVDKETIQLKFSISTSDTPELKRTAELIKEDLATIGVEVELKIFEIGDLNQNVIRPRKYDALLFGQIVSQESSLFAFWHSSQRNDPGLNVALYANLKVDKLLEDALNFLDTKERLEKYIQFREQIKKDTPAVFIYSPEFIYVVSKNIKGLSINHLNVTSDRFLEINKWYLEINKIWKIFNK